MNVFPWYFTAMTALSVLVSVVFIAAPIGIWINVRQMAKQMRAQTALLEARADEARRAAHPPRANRLDDVAIGGSTPAPLHRW